jgi:uncharacterized membrane protein YphA (DoxX/SURF4 family)
MAGSMSTILPRATLHLLCRGVPAAVLLWAGMAKAFDHQAAVIAVDAYDVLPDAGVRVVAWILPWLEIGLAVLLILGLFTRAAGAATAAAAAVFVVALAQAKARGLRIDCGCFGAGGAGAGVSWFEILRDLPIVLAGAYLAVRPRGPLRLDAYFEDFDPTDPREEDDGERIPHLAEARAQADQG